MSLVLGLGLEHSSPWPREGLSSEELFLALASDFFCVLDLGLELCVLDSTSANRVESIQPTYCNRVGFKPIPTPLGKFRDALMKFSCQPWFWLWRNGVENFHQHHCKTSCKKVDWNRSRELGLFFTSGFSIKHSNKNFCFLKIFGLFSPLQEWGSFADQNMQHARFLLFILTKTINK